MCRLARASSTTIVADRTSIRKLQDKGPLETPDKTLFPSLETQCIVPAAGHPDLRSRGGSRFDLRRYRCDSRRYRYDARNRAEVGEVIESALTVTQVKEPQWVSGFPN